MQLEVILLTKLLLNGTHFNYNAVEKSVDPVQNERDQAIDSI